MVIGKTICRVSREFLPTETVRGKCRTPNLIKRSFSIYVWDLPRDIFCLQKMGYFSIGRPDEKFALVENIFESSISRNVIVKPKIVTNDESLRRYIPEQ